MKQVAVASTQTAQDRSSVVTDAQWQALANARPAQIDAWLTANVTDLASARRVLRLLLLAVRYLKAKVG